MDDDERTVELECIAAIFPEIVLNPLNPFSASIELPVNPRNPVKVTFPAPSDGLLPTPPRSDSSNLVAVDATANPADNVESHNLSYLPSIQLHINLPAGYPEDKPPKFELSTVPQWLSPDHLNELQTHGDEVWEENGHGQTVYGYIDFLQQCAENAFGLAEGHVLEIPQSMKISLLDFDIKATQAAFAKETFDCGVCLDPKKGSVCHRMIDCGHVFCVQCLQDFYNNAIKEGDLVSVKCLDPGCAKERENARAGASKKARKPKTLSPSELLQIPIEHDLVTRYVKLKHKADLESDKNTIYCPRKWCQGAAISKKHRKPVGLEIDDQSDNESENEGTDSDGKKDYTAGKDRLSICEDCSFAFCNRCYQGWHGEITICMPKRDTGELTAEEKASMEYMKLHTSPCPTCAAPAQKTHGCNHMICFKCQNHFCYLCSAWLSPANPYQHYNEVKSGCYMRLWELEGGDGNDVDIGFAGGHHGPAPAAVEELHPMPEVEEVIDQVPEIEDPDGNIVEPGPARAPLEREGPLVLRINALPPRPPPAPEVPEAPRGGRNQRQAPPVRLRGGAPPRRQRRQPRGQNVNPVPAPLGQEAAQQAWVQMFVQMAMNDEEDELDSDDEDDEAWEIPVR
ncbi:RWD domain-containing protein [Tricladium varicosporioides]|nr:RWD domain-containing protein [Hymenoscyphus varicosporioides]